MSFTFVPNKKGLDRLVRGDGVRDLVNHKTNRVLADAQVSAPRHTGDYERSLGSNGAHLTVDGWQGEVFSTDPFWHLIEFGSVNNPPYRTLSKAVTSAGLKFTDVG